MKALLKTSALAALAVSLAGPAFAHTGAGATHGLLAGIGHPLLGPDHLLAMLSVGVWSALAVPGRAWLAPLAFVSAMLAGAGLSLAGIGLPAVEGMIAASVLVLGLMVVAGGRMPVTAGVALCGLFAMFHGHAHAGEATGTVLAYIAGFSLSTAAIHLAGIGIGRAVSRQTLARYAVGGLVTAAGAFILAGL